MIKPLLLFDMDGTLIIPMNKPKYTVTTTGKDSYESIKTQMKKIAVKHGVPSDLVTKLDRMSHIWNVTRRFLEEKALSNEEIQTIMDELNVPFMVEEKADHACSVLIPNTLEALNSLKNLGYEMGIVTTASRESYDRISRQNDYGYFGRFFKHSITRDDCWYIKPDPEPIERILKLFKRNDFAYIGDSDHDALACRKVGGIFVLLNTRKFDLKSINKLQPKAIINNLTELPDALDNL